MNNFSRRRFMKDAAASLAGITMAMNGAAKELPTGAASENFVESQATLSFDLMKEVAKYPKVDSHVHVSLGSKGPEDNDEFFDRLGFTRMFISRPVNKKEAPPAAFIQSNDMMYDAMKKYPGKMTGMFTLNPMYKKESLEEIKKRVDQGFVGLKVYYQVKINDPLFYPIIEKMIDLKMITLMHAEATLGTGGYRMKYDKKRMPNTSIPEDFVDIAKRYPEAMFQYAHTGGGPDWEYALKALKHSPNVYIDTSGSNNEENMIDFAVREVGEDRLFFGTDNMYFQGVGKILSSNLTDVQKRKLFCDNYNNILKKSGNQINISNK